MESLVVITGGTQGLGLELVKLFSKNNKVLVIARTKREELKGVFYEYGNLSDETFIKNVYEKYSKEYSISYLINNAAAGVFGSPEINTKENKVKNEMTNLSISNFMGDLQLSRKAFKKKIINDDGITWLFLANSVNIYS